MFGGSTMVEVVTVTNRNGWMFKEVHPQFTMALLTLARGVPSAQSIAIRGPYASRGAWDLGSKKQPYRFAKDSVLTWTSSASLPLLPTDDSVGVFAQMRASPWLDLKANGAWRARPDTELHATGDKGLMTFDPTNTASLWPVMKGESFDIWENDRGPETYYAWANPAIVRKMLQDKRLRSAKSRRDSAHTEFPLAHVRDARTLSCQEPRIAFRDVTRATDTRTVRAALVPPEVFLNHKAPYLLWPSGDAKDQAFLLGVLSSVPLDWYARRFVEISLTYFVLNPFPIPRPPRTDALWQRAVDLAGRLASPDNRFAAWAKSVGVACGPLAPEQKQLLIEELDAVVAKLYGLSSDQLTHVFDTFHEWTEESQANAWAARRDRTIAILRGLP
jgi:hypothetical protein